MRHSIRVGRMGMLAAGLGISAALASIPPVASADTAADPYSWLDQALSGLPAPAADAAAPLDMQISLSGMDLFSTIDNTATANSSFGDIAIAFGNGANASASRRSLTPPSPTAPTAVPAPGWAASSTSQSPTAPPAVRGAGWEAISSIAIANGDNSSRRGELAGNFVIATAVGEGSSAVAGTGGNFDIATATGTGSSANVGLGGNSTTHSPSGTGSYASRRRQLRQRHLTRRRQQRDRRRAATLT